MNKYKYSRKEILKKLKEAINGKWFSSSGEENYKEAVKMLLEKQPDHISDAPKKADNTHCTFCGYPKKGDGCRECKPPADKCEHKLMDIFGCLECGATPNLFKSKEKSPTLNLPVVEPLKYSLNVSPLPVEVWKTINELVAGQKALREAVLKINERR